MSNNDILKQYRKLRPTELATALFRVKGRKLDFTGYKPFIDIYNTSAPVITLRSSRQTGKSLSISGMLTANSILRPNYGSLMISPQAEQASRFSTTYLLPMLSTPLIKKHFTNSDSKKNVFYQSLSNGSYIILGYGSSSEDMGRIRGASVDSLYIDEVQSISYDAIPVVKETLTAAETPFIRYCGTSLGESGTLELQWKLSNQLEWVVKCSHCGRHTIPIDVETCMKLVTMNPDGPACVHCGNILDMSTGKWLAARPDIKNHVGFHIAAFSMPIRNKPSKWRELKEKLDTYGHTKLANEVFGLPSSMSGRILSLRELMNCCDEEDRKWDTCFPHDSRHICVTVVGVDWSTSGSSKSYTVISVLGYDYNGKCYLLYVQKIDGVDILAQVARVEQLYHQFECSIVGSDRGVGVLQGQMMKQHLGEDKVVMVNYVAAKTALRWDKIAGYYAADRTMSIDTIVMKAKIGKTRLVAKCWNLMGAFFQDYLNVFEEETLAGRRIYKKDEDLCDDALHSAVFGNIAYQVLKGEFVFVDETPAASTTFDLSKYK